MFLASSEVQDADAADTEEDIVVGSEDMAVGSPHTGRGAGKPLLLSLIVAS